MGEFSRGKREEKREGKARKSNIFSGKRIETDQLRAAEKEETTTRNRQNRNHKVVILTRQAPYLKSKSRTNYVDQ